PGCRAWYNYMRRDVIVYSCKWAISYLLPVNGCSFQVTIFIYCIGCSSVRHVSFNYKLFLPFAGANKRKDHESQKGNYFNYY
ncbi:MAG TPA: hypothetical protein VK609_11365, partial [Mucilaginibacter sp.]|nr:hypothetical protein [Mucilaginibacter sp.]